MHELTVAAHALGEAAGNENGKAMPYLLGLPEIEAIQVTAEAMDTAELNEPHDSGSPLQFGLYMFRLGVELGVAAERRTQGIAAGGE